MVVYATNMAEQQIAADIKAVNEHISKEVDANADERAKVLNEVQAAS